MSPTFLTSTRPEVEPLVKPAGVEPTRLVRQTQQTRTVTAKTRNQFLQLPAAVMRIMICPALQLAHMGYLAPAPLSPPFPLPHFSPELELVSLHLLAACLSILDLTNPTQSKHCTSLVQDTSRCVGGVGWDTVTGWLVDACLFCLFGCLICSLLCPPPRGWWRRSVVSSAVVMVGGRLCAADEDVVEGDVDW
jgi:hypothetical protein